MPLNLTSLKSGDRVRYRTSRRDNADGTAPEWSQWKEGNLFLQRREQSLPKRLRGGRNCKSHEAGAIITLTINGAGWAEYSEDDYSPEDNEWLCEEYRLEFEPL